MGISCSSAGQQPYAKLINASQLHHAAEMGDLKMVKSSLKKGALLDSRTKEGFTPLHLACQHRRKSVCRYLIKKGANTNAQDNEGLTPMHIVCRNAFSIRILSLMIKNGADVNAITRNKRNALHLIANKMEISDRRKQRKICDLLLKSGCSVNVKNDDSMTPLHCAVFNEQLEVCELLLISKAEVNARAHEELTPLHVAIGGNDEETKDYRDIVELLLFNKADINALDINGQTPLHYAACKGHPMIMQVLLSFHGADPNIKDHKGRTPLHIAASKGDERLVLTLLRSAQVHVNVNATVSNGGPTALYLAAMSGSLATVESLIDHGADCESVVEHFDRPCRMDREGRNRWPIVRWAHGTILMLRAAQHDDNNIVRLCIRQGIKINARDASGRSALYFAVQNGNIAQIRYLLENGAKLDTTTCEGYTALHKALMREEYLIADILLQHAVAKLEPVSLIEFLDTKSADREETALHIAVGKTEFVNSQLETVKLLIQSGAMYNSKNKDGLTPANLAKSKQLKDYFRQIDDMFGCTEAAQLSEKLEEHPTIVNARDHYHGLTALHWLIANTNDQQSMKLLLKRKTNVWLMDKQGYTVLHTASYKGHDGIIDDLINECPKESRKLFVNFKSFKDKYSPLHLAANEAVALKLLRHGASWDIKDSRGDIPYDTTNDYVRRLINPKRRRLCDKYCRSRRIYKGRKYLSNCFKRYLWEAFHYQSATDFSNKCSCRF